MRVEPGRFTDQRYLHDWPQSRPGVKVLQDLGGGVGPWNMHQYSFNQRNGVLEVNGFPLIFVHFQSLRLYRGAAWLRRWGFWGGVFKLTRGRRPLVWMTDPDWDIREIDYELLWQPYVRELAVALEELRRVEFGFDMRIRPPRELLVRAARLSTRAAIRAIVPPPLRQPGYRAYRTLRRLAHPRAFAAGERGASR
jgi:hypothetical protein